MTLHEFPDIAQRSPEWDALRRGMVTASAVGRLLTPTLKVADNETSRGLVALLAAERITGHSEPGWVTHDMWRGIEMEPYARDLYGKHFAPAQECGFLVRDFDGFKLGFSPDGLIGDDGLIEIKAPREKAHLETVVAGQVPDRHMAQLQCGLLVSGRRWVDFVSFAGGMALWTQRVEPDESWFAAITAAASQAEVAINAIVAQYSAATAGLPVAERVDLEVVI